MLKIGAKFRCHRDSWSHSVCSLTVALALSSSALGAPVSDWRSFGNDQGASRFTELRQIDARNVGQLQVAWTYHMRPTSIPASSVSTNDTSAELRNSRFSLSEATPIVANGVMYLPTPYGKVVALDARTGQEKWSYQLPERDQASTRGVQYWPGGKGAKPEIIFGTRSGRLVAIDAATGVPVASFGNAGIVDLKTPDIMNGNPRSQYGVTGPPAFYRNVIMTGSRVQESPSIGASGDVRAWDATTGKLLWTFHTIPKPGELGHDTWAGDSWKGRSGVNVWTQIVVDEKRGIAYLPIAAPSFDRWGGDRAGANLFGDSLVAVDAATGKYLWHFQVVHHDIWDVDLPAATLIDVKRDGHTIPAIAIMSKMAILFMLDRTTGKPIYDVQEVAVPTDTDVPDEKPWPTQPMPVAPPPLTRLSFELGDLADMTPDIKARCQKIVDDLHIVPSKMFQPLRVDSAIAFFPGSLGGVDFGGGSFDPRRGLYIINVNSLASPEQLAKRPNGSYDLARGYVYFQDRETRTPCGKPPWGELMAIDVNTAKIVWRRPLGTTDTLPEGLRETGRISSGFPVLTASGLAFFGGTDENKLRAFDVASGKLLWTTPLPASIYGSAMSYQAGGSQFVAAVVTGGFNNTPVASDEVIAWALPSKYKRKP